MLLCHLFRLICYLKKIYLSWLHHFKIMPEIKFMWPDDLTSGKIVQRLDFCAKIDILGTLRNVFLREGSVIVKKQTQLDLQLGFHFTIDQPSFQLIYTSYLKYYFQRHVCLSVRSSVRAFVCLKNSSNSCRRITRCH